MFTDPIADMLTRIRNAQMAKKPSCDMPSSKLKKAVLDILVAHEYILGYEELGEVKKELRVALKYFGRTPAIQSITRESTPGHRMYRKSDELPKVLNDYGIAIVSTSQGLMTNKDARKKGVGGEVICSIY